ncbi:cation:proton antiporter [Candidatus Pacearchaeota archaeon]|nr:cation:proton antiporter [Candidatus Pacearchaeota archaeon]
MIELTGRVVEAVNGVAHHIGALPPSEAIIFDIAVILILSAMFAFVARTLRQPLIPAYVLTGLVLGPLVFGVVKNLDLIGAFSEIGIAFLLFTAGLEISLRKIREANLKKIALIGVLQVGVIFGVALLLANFLGLGSLQAAYIGIILAFGSTMVDIKLLSDRNELVTLHGRLVLGILLLQDLVAIVAIVVFTGGGFAILPLTVAFIKLGLILLAAILLQRFVLNRLFRFAAQSNEFLFLCSLAVLFFFIILAYVFELSIVIGAFIAGVSLANSPFKFELESRISPLRDFFAILFFVALGMQLVFVGIGDRLILLGALLIGAFLVKPIVTFVLLRTTGYQPRTGFLTAISLAQLSEFSLIIGMIGVTAGVLDSSIFSTVILATIITMSVTPYLIEYKGEMYRFFRYPIRSLKFLPVREVLCYEDKKDKEVLLVGSHRMGGALMEELLDKKDKLLVVDYNPEVIGALMKKKISCVYGDICSPGMIDKLNLKKLKLVVSTIPDYEHTRYLLKKFRKIAPKAKIIVTGSRISETMKLYRAGVDYVVTPKILAGQELANIVHNRKVGDLKKARKKHLTHLREIHRLLY